MDFNTVGIVSFNTKYIFLLKERPTIGNNLNKDGMKKRLV